MSVNEWVNGPVPSNSERMAYMSQAVSCLDVPMDASTKQSDDSVDLVIDIVEEIQEDDTI